MSQKRCVLLISIILFVIVGSFWSCSDPISSPPESEPEFIRPLTFGNQWFGTKIYFTQDGPYDTIRTSHILVGDTTFAGAIWSRMFNDSDDTSQFADPYSTYLRNDSLGQWESLGIGENLLAKYPAAKLDSFPYDMGDTIVQNVVIAIDTFITVPAGEFSCYNYQYSFHSWYGGEDFKMSYYFSPGVGQIKYEFYAKSSQADTVIYLKTLWELDSLKLVTPE